MKIVILTKGTNNTSALIFIESILKNNLNLEKIIVEKNSSIELKKINIFKYFNIFKIFNKLYEKIFCNKLPEYIEGYENLLNIDILKDKVELVQNHNSDEVENILKKVNADVILVLGTRILEERIFSNSKIAINFHSGIVPMYKGSYTVFWAMRNRDWDNVGYIFHEVAKKLDSGKVIFEKKINVEKNDNERSVFKKIEYDGAKEVINLLLLLQENDYKIKSVEQQGLEKTYKGIPSSFEWFLLTLILIKKRIWN